MEERRMETERKQRRREERQKERKRRRQRYGRRDGGEGVRGTLSLPSVPVCLSPSLISSSYSLPSLPLFLASLSLPLRLFLSSSLRHSHFPLPASVPVFLSSSALSLASEKEKGDERKRGTD